MKILISVVVAVLTIVLAGLLWVAREVPAEDVAVPADAIQVLSSPLFAVPEGWQWRELQTEAGKIRWGETRLEDPVGVVFFLPGLSAPMEVYFEAFSRFRREGYSVVAMDWPGQAGSSRGSRHPQKIHAESLDGHVEAARDLMAKSFTVDDGSPTLLVGLSMGAQLGARVIATSPKQQFNAAALITPAFGIYNGRPTYAERLALTALKTLGLGERYAPGNSDWVFEMDVYNQAASFCSHPNARTKIWQSSMVANPALKVGGFTNSFVLALADSAAIARSNSTLDKISVPVWMPVAEGDVFVDNSIAAAACVGLAQCVYQRYAEARHCLFEESDEFYAPFMEDLVEFLRSQTPVTVN